MLKYIVIERANIPDLVKEVNKSMESDYVPIGGISKWSKGGATGFMQALILMDEVQGKKWWKL